MSQQHSFDLGDLRAEPKTNGASEQTGRDMLASPQALETTSNVASPIRETRRHHTSDPRVPLSQEVVAAVFGPSAERRFAVRYWDGTFEPAGATSTPDFTLALQRPGALRRMLLPATELSIAESFLSGDVEIEGRMESAMYLGDALGKRLQSPAEVMRLLRKLVALPRDPATAPILAITHRSTR